MNVCVYVLMFICLYEYMFICSYVYMFVCLCVHIWLWCTCLHGCALILLYAHMFTYVLFYALLRFYALVCRCVCVCMCVCFVLFVIFAVSRASEHRNIWACRHTHTNISAQQHPSILTQRPIRNTPRETWLYICIFSFHVMYIVHECACANTY